MQFLKLPGAVIPIFFALFLIGCTNGISEAEQHFNTGLVLHLEGRFEEAIVEYDQAIRLDPQYADAYHSLGNVSFVLEQYGRALDNYNEAIRLDPLFANSYAGRAMTYTLLGEDKEAEQDVERAIGLGFDRSTLDGLIEDSKKQR